MTAAEALVYAYLRTCRHTHMAGIAVLPRGYIVADLPQLAATEVETAMVALESRGLIRTDQPRNVVWIVDLAESQVDGGNQIKAIERHLAGLHGSPLAEEWRRAYPQLCAASAPAEGAGQGATQAPCGGAYQGGAPQEQDQEQDQTQEQAPRGAGGETRRLAPPAEAVRLARLLADLMRRNDPKARVPADLTPWATELDRLHRIDRRDWPEIERVLRWSQADSFWRCNILSAAKLRKKFGQLALKSQPAASSPRTSSGPPPAAEVLANLDARRGGAA